MLLATDQEGMRILMDPNLAYSVPLDTPPWGGPELPTGFSVCYKEFNHAVRQNFVYLLHTRMDLGHTLKKKLEFSPFASFN